MLPEQQSPKLRHEYLALAIAAATFLVYIGSLKYGFVFDDGPQIVSNPFIRSWRYVGQYFTHQVWAGLLPNTNYYRPLFLVCLRFNEALFGLNPFGWHLANVLVHVVVILLVFKLVNRLFRNIGMAAIAAAIFGLHPVQVQSVSWISSISDPLMCAFLIASFLAYLKYRDARKGAWLAASVLRYFCAALTKEPGIVLAGVIFSYEWARSGAEHSRKRRFREAALATVPFAMTALAYAALRIHALGGVAPVKQNSWQVSALTWPAVLWLYVKHLAMPWGYAVYYDVPLARTVWSKEFLVPCALLVFTFLLLRLVWRTLHIDKRTAWTAGTWFLFPILPTLYLRTLREGTFGQDRYLYVSTIGFAILCAAVIVRFPRSRLAFDNVSLWQVAVTSLLLTVLTISTLIQQQYWTSDLVLFARAVQVSPDNEEALTHAGLMLALRGETGLSAGMFERILRRDPDSPGANYNLGFVLYQMGNYSGAMPHFEKAARAGGDMAAGANLHMGIAHFHLGDWRKADEEIRRAIALQPKRQGVHLALATVLESQGDRESAEREIREELQNYPDDQAARGRLAELQNQTPRRDK